MSMSIPAFTRTFLLIASIGLGNMSRAEEVIFVKSPKQGEPALTPILPLKREPLILPDPVPPPKHELKKVEECVKNEPCPEKPCAKPVSCPDKSCPTCCSGWSKLAQCFKPRTCEPCECKPHATAYRPPLYTWFPCKTGSVGCSTAMPVFHHQVAAVVPAIPIEAPLPKPVTPSITQKERPFISGSTIVLSDYRILPPKQEVEKGKEKEKELILPYPVTPEARQVMPVRSPYGPNWNNTLKQGE